MTCSPRGRSRARIAFVLLLFLLGTNNLVRAQQPAGAGAGKTEKPDSPVAKVQGEIGETTSTMFGYLTNRSFFFPDIATSPKALTADQKFKLFLNESVSPAAFTAAGVSAGIQQARDVPEAYGQGWGAYGSRLGAGLARNASNSFFGTFALASVLHQDPRFFPRVNPTFWSSVKYAAKRIVVTRKDSGGETFDASGIFGTLGGETLANVYLPRSEQTGAKTAERVGTDLAARFVGNLFKEYWPVFFRDLGLKRLGVIPEPAVPATAPTAAPH